MFSQYQLPVLGNEIPSFLGQQRKKTRLEIRDIQEIIP